MSVTIESLNQTATDYHNSEAIADKFIEECAQIYMCNAMKQYLGEQDSILEMGFGDGITCAFFSRRHKDYSVLEGSDFLIRSASTKFPSVKFIHGLFEEFQPAQKFRKILALHVLEHVDDPSALLKQMRGWLDSNGQILVIVPNSESLHRRLALLMGLQDRLDSLSKRDLLVGHQRVFDLLTLRAVLNEAGYNCEIERGFGVKTLPNSMMLNFPESLHKAHYEISPQLHARICANLFVIASKRNESSVKKGF